MRAEHQPQSSRSCEKTVAIHESRTILRRTRSLRSSTMLPHYVPHPATADCTNATWIPRCQFPQPREVARGGTLTPPIVRTNIRDANASPHHATHDIIPSHFHTRPRPPRSDERVPTFLLRSSADRLTGAPTRRSIAPALSPTGLYAHSRDRRPRRFDGS